MKIQKMIAISILLFSTNIFAFEGYNFSPIEDDGYSSDNYSNDDLYNDLNQPAYSAPKFKKSFRRTNNEFSSAGKLFVFDPNALRWYAYQNGNLISSGRASGGRYYCPDIKRGCKTPIGMFQIGRKGGPDCRSNKYPIGKGNAPMPWCMFFKGGYAIHGGPVPNFNASHGCIRVTPPDARWLSHNFLSAGTKVLVKSY